jgi:hypothetical protein
VVAPWAPDITAFLFLLFIGGLRIATGLLKIVLAMLMLSGLAALPLGLILLISPAGAIVLSYLHRNHAEGPCCTRYRICCNGTPEAVVWLAERCVEY